MTTKLQVIKIIVIIIITSIITIIIIITVKLCHDMAEAASCQPPTSESWV